MPPSVRSVGSYSTPGSTSPHSVPTPGSFQSGDLLMAVFEFATGANTNHVSATGWTELVWNSITAVVGRTALSVMGRISDGGEGSSVSFDVTGTINHVSGRMLAVQDHGLSVIGDIVSGTVTSGVGSGADPQTDTISGITVTADSLVFMVGSSGFDADTTTEYSTWTNSNLSSITEHMDNGSLVGNGGGFGVAAGVCSGTTTGSSTYQRANNYDYNNAHIGVKPGGSGTTYTKTGIAIHGP